MKKIRALVIKVIVLAVVLGFTTVSYAHDVSQRGLVHGRDATHVNVGWLIRESWHNGSTHLRYRNDPNDPHLSAYIPLIAEAAGNSVNGWGGAPYRVERVTTSGTGVGIVRTFNQVSNVLAQYEPTAIDVSTGHVTAWRIEINRHNGANLVLNDMVHEFGHAFGLLDLYNSSNKDKTMYGVGGQGVNRLHAADLRGASVITGVHGGVIPHTNPHVFNKLTMNPNLVPAGFHAVMCSTCDGLRSANTIVPHVWTIFNGITATSHMPQCACGAVGSAMPHVWVGNTCRDCGWVR